MFKSSEYSIADDLCVPGETSYDDNKPDGTPPPTEVEEFSSAETTTSAETEERAGTGMCEVCLRGTGRRSNRVCRPILPCTLTSYLNPGVLPVFVAISLLSVL